MSWKVIHKKNPTWFKIVDEQEKNNYETNYYTRGKYRFEEVTEVEPRHTALPELDEVIISSGEAVNKKNSRKSSKKTD